MTTPNWHEVISFLHTYYAHHSEKETLTGADMVRAADLFVKTCGDEQQVGHGNPVAVTPYVVVKVESQYVPNKIIVFPTCDNTVDLIVVNHQYNRFRNVLVKAEEWNRVQL